MEETVQSADGCAGQNTADDGQRNAVEAQDADHDGSHAQRRAFRKVDGTQRHDKEHAGGYDGRIIDLGEQQPQFLRCQDFAVRHDVHDDNNDYKADQRQNRLEFVSGQECAEFGLFNALVFLFHSLASLIPSSRSGLLHSGPDYGGIPRSPFRPS